MPEHKHESNPRISISVKDRLEFTLNVEIEGEPSLDYVIIMVQQALKGLESERRYQEQLEHFKKAQRYAMDQAAALRVVAGGRS